MKLFRILFFIAITSLLFFDTAMPAYGQNGIFSYKNRIPPKAVLVQLKSEEKRKVVLERSNNKKDLDILTKDVTSVNRVMVNDFRDHITVCPVYFFYEKDADKVIKGALEGVVFDSLKNPVDQAVLAALDTNYLVVYYGVPMAEAHEAIIQQDFNRTSTIAVYDGLVALNYHFQNMPKPFDFFIGHSHVTRWLSFYLTDKKYNFASKRFYIEYIASARDLDARIRSYYRLSKDDNN